MIFVALPDALVRSAKFMFQRWGRKGKNCGCYQKLSPHRFVDIVTMDGGIDV